MSFMFGLSDELEKLAGEEGSTMYGHGDGDDKKKPSVAKGMAVGGAAGAAYHHGGGEVQRQVINKRFGSKGADEVGRAMEHGGNTASRYAGKLLRAGSEGAKPFHKQLAKTAPLSILMGGLAGAGVQKLRHRGEKKEAGLMSHAKPGILRKVVSKIPKKAVGAAALAGGAYGAGHHKGLKKGEGEAMQVGEQAYESGARDMEGALLSQLGVS